MYYVLCVVSKQSHKNGAYPTIPMCILIVDTIIIGIIV